MRLALYPFLLESTKRNELTIKASAWVSPAACWVGSGTIPGLLG